MKNMANAWPRFAWTCSIVGWASCWLPVWLMANDWPAPVTQQEAWAALPKADEGADSPLPTWARTLAPTLPHTTAAILELEYVYRTESSKIPNWRELVSVARYSVATFHQSAYGKQVAMADLKRLDAQAIIDALESDPETLSPLHAEVYRFARQMAEAGRLLTDAQYRSMQSKLGDEGMVGLVLQIAHGCFQDRLLLALCIADVADANLDPIKINFVDSTPNGANTPAAIREDAESLMASIDHDKQIAAPEDAEAPSAPKSKLAGWDDFNSFDLQQRLEVQRARTPRITVPNWEAIVGKLPTNLYRRPMRIRWSRIVVGYQPKLGPAWIRCLRIFEQESHQNRVFEESVFWVVTRSLRCFYCMGHCEMLMEVGGLKKPAIAARTARMSDTDWSSFSPQEQAAFAFAKKLTESPTEMTRADLVPLRDALGDTRTLDLIWWTSRCQFMTKVSDAFQLQLERDNVFAE